MPLRIILNFAITADGKISTRSLTPAHFTSKRDLERLHEIRNQADAILVGRGTLEADSMSLTTPGATPWRCVVSRNGEFRADHPFFHTEGGPRHLIITEKHAPTDLPATTHQMSLPDWLSWLDEHPEITTLLCEGGGFLTRELFSLDRVDEIYLTWATHTMFGGQLAPGITGIPGKFLPTSGQYQLVNLENGSPGEVYLHYRRAN